MEPFVFTEGRRALPGETGVDVLEPVPLPLQPRAQSGLVASRLLVNIDSMAFKILKQCGR
ncbi:MAG TPA: hypothetical protein VMV84_02230 [Dehalococcoidales bacterium]|nr:hypothetical protein [Dehalococcoidales bacterium]